MYDTIQGGPGQSKLLIIIAITLSTDKQLSQFLVHHVHSRKLATGQYIVSPSNIV